MAAEIRQPDYVPAVAFIKEIPLPLRKQAFHEIEHILNTPENFQGRTFVKGLTIDPDGSRDRDDAIWITKQEDGRCIVDVSIADVATYIHEGQALDTIAQLNPSSLYNDSGIVYSMFPAVLGEKRLSLLQGQDRLTMTIRMQLSAKAELEDVSIFPSFMKSPADLSYAEAADILSHPENELYDVLCLADKVARKLHTKHKTSISEENTVQRRQQRGEDRMHQMVGEFMLLANAAVARFAFAYGIPIIYRNHKPDKEGALQANAYYSDISEGHAATGLPYYAHVTSPIRRYADVFAWRMIKRFLSGKHIDRASARRAGRVARRINAFGRESGIQ